MQYVKLTAAIAARVQAALFTVFSFLGLTLVLIGATAVVATAWLVGTALRNWPSPKFWKLPAPESPPRRAFYSIGSGY